MAYKKLNKRVTIVIRGENDNVRARRRANSASCPRLERLRGRDSNPNFLVQSQASYR